MLQFISTALAPPACAQEKAAPATGAQQVIITGTYSPPGSDDRISLTDDKIKFKVGKNPPDEYIIKSADNRQALVLAKPGDRITASIVAAEKRIEKIIRVDRTVDRWRRSIALGISLLLLFLLSLFFTKGKTEKLILGADNRYSNSMFQIVAWFAVFASVYGATLILRVWEFGSDFLGGINIPNNLLVLTGLSAFSYGGAKMITTQKAEAADATTTKTEAPPTPDLRRDLVSNSAGAFDFGDFQMLLVTLAAVVIYGLVGFHFLGSLPVEITTTLPDVDTTLLSGFGIGQGAYLAKKAASKLGQG